MEISQAQSIVNSIFDQEGLSALLHKVGLETSTKSSHLRNKFAAEIGQTNWTQLKHTLATISPEQRQLFISVLTGKFKNPEGARLDSLISKIKKHVRHTVVPIISSLIRYDANKNSVYDWVDLEEDPNMHEFASFIKASPDECMIFLPYIHEKVQKEFAFDVLLASKDATQLYIDLYNTNRLWMNVTTFSLRAAYKEAIVGEDPKSSLDYDFINKVSSLLDSHVEYYLQYIQNPIDLKILEELEQSIDNNGITVGMGHGFAVYAQLPMIREIDQL